jgi:hypothetical protein
MAIDQNLSPPAPEAAPAAAIENEIPAYRAISPLAIVSLLFGVLSILSVAHGFFLSCAVAAVVLGFLADRKIQRYPDILTGRGFAQAGIMLGMVFGLGTFTVSTVQSYLRAADATRFAKRFAVVLKDEPIENVLWLKQPPFRRKDKSPAQLIEEFKTASKDPRMIEMELATVRMAKSRLAGAKGEEIHFSRLEAHGMDGLDAYAAALYELHGPGSKDYPLKEQYALMLMKGRTEKGKIGWYVEDFRFPYTPSTYAPASKPVDDGHGHAH